MRDDVVPCVNYFAFAVCLTQRSLRSDYVSGQGAFVSGAGDAAISFIFDIVFWLKGCETISFY